MGSDDLYKKRRKDRTALRKREAIERQAKSRILVLCEGETEVAYISMFAKFHKSKIVVDVSAKCPTCPAGMADTAIEIKEHDSGYDSVFLVFDLDVVSIEKIGRVDDLARQHELKLIKSDPCFEYWLLLHFTYTRKPYNRLPKKSPCDQVVSDLKQIKGIESYDKVASINLALLMSNVDTAIIHAKRSFAESLSVKLSNPSTNMYELIDYISKPSN